MKKPTQLLVAFVASSIMPHVAFASTIIVFDNNRAVVANAVSHSFHALAHGMTGSR
jgi:hypothetical protein